MESNFGHINRGGDIAICSNCNHVAYMTSDYRNQSIRELTILHHLNGIEKCCAKPDYDFKDVSFYRL